MMFGCRPCNYDRCACCAGAVSPARSPESSPQLHGGSRCFPLAQTPSAAPLRNLPFAGTPPAAPVRGLPQTPPPISRNIDRSIVAPAAGGKMLVPASLCGAAPWTGSAFLSPLRCSTPPCNKQNVTHTPRPNFPCRPLVPVLPPTTDKSTATETGFEQGLSAPIQLPRFEPPPFASPLPVPDSPDPSPVVNSATCRHEQQSPLRGVSLVADSEASTDSGGFGASAEQFPWPEDRYWREEPLSEGVEPRRHLYLAEEEGQSEAASSSSSSEGPMGTSVVICAAGSDRGGSVDSCAAVDGELHGNFNSCEYGRDPDGRNVTHQTVQETDADVEPTMQQHTQLSKPPLPTRPSTQEKEIRPQSYSLAQQARLQLRAAAVAAASASATYDGGCVRGGVAGALAAADLYAAAGCVGTNRDAGIARLSPDSTWSLSSSSNSSTSGDHDDEAWDIPTSVDCAAPCGSHHRHHASILAPSPGLVPCPLRLAPDTAAALFLRDFRPEPAVQLVSDDGDRWSDRTLVATPSLKSIEFLSPLPCHVTGASSSTTGMEPAGNHSKDALKIGERVQRRDKGEEWRWGYVKSLSPLKVTFNDNPSDDAYYKWDEVRKAEQLPCLDLPRRADRFDWSPEAVQRVIDYAAEASLVTAAYSGGTGHVTAAATSSTLGSTGGCVTPPGCDHPALHTTDAGYGCSSGTSVPQPERLSCATLHPYAAPPTP